MGHQLHRGVEFVLQIPDLILFPFPFIADQRHGSHPGEPVQVLVLERGVGEQVRRRDETWSDLTGSLPGLRDYRSSQRLVLSVSLQIFHKQSISSVIFFLTDFWAQVQKFFFSKFPFSPFLP